MPGSGTVYYVVFPAPSPPAGCSCPRTPLPPRVAGLGWGCRGAWLWCLPCGVPPPPPPRRLLLPPHAAASQGGGVGLGTQRCLASGALYNMVCSAPPHTLLPPPHAAAFPLVLTCSPPRRSRPPWSFWGTALAEGLHTPRLEAGTHNTVTERQTWGQELWGCSQCPLP